MRITRMLSGLMVILMCSAVAAMAQQWYVQSADWGAGNRRQDVTNNVRRLMSGSDFRANNQNMGIDPAKGRDKTLRIIGRNSSGQVRTFTYNEGQMVSTRMFTANDWSDRWNGQRNSTLQIVQAEWRPLNGRHGRVVTPRLQGMVRNNRLDITADNKTMGGDPAPGQPKELYIVYRYQRQNITKRFGENARVNLP